MGYVRAIPIARRRRKVHILMKSERNRGGSASLTSASLWSEQLMRIAAKQLWMPRRFAGIWATILSRSPRISMSEFWRAPSTSSGRPAVLPLLKELPTEQRKIRRRISMRTLPGASMKWERKSPGPIILTPSRLSSGFPAASPGSFWIMTSS